MVSGVAAFEVPTIFSSPFGSITNQAHAEPNKPVAVFVNSSLNFSKEPHLAFINSASFPFGSFCGSAEKPYK